jgi:hypothetical protein
VYWIISNIASVYLKLEIPAGVCLQISLSHKRFLQVRSFLACFLLHFSPK